MPEIRHYGKKSKLYVFFFLAFLILTSLYCMDPGQYEPEEPPVKTDPPEAPSVLLPVQDALFRSQYSITVTLAWTEVEDAEGYEYQVDSDSSFASSFPHLCGNDTTGYYAYCIPPITTYFLRVRAHSSAWTWYTDWSDLRRFHIMPVEDDTIF